MDYTYTVLQPLAGFDGSGIARLKTDEAWAPSLHWAATPPRGWNSYDAFTWRVTEAEFLANCEYVAAHLLAHGYEYCVVDYLWFQVGADISDRSAQR
jgi:hypothetical protein